MWSQLVHHWTLYSLFHSHHLQMFLSCSCGRKQWSLYAYFLNANNRFEHCSSTPMNRMSDKQYLSPPSPNLSGFISFCFYYFPTSAPNLLSFFPFSVFNSFAGIMQGLCHRLIAYLDTSKDFFPFFFLILQVLNSCKFHLVFQVHPKYSGQRLSRKDQ